jgi:hypothetical protein
MSRRATMGMICVGDAVDRSKEAAGASVEVHHDSGAVTIHVPLRLYRRGGRKLIMAADGSPLPLSAAGHAVTGNHGPLVKALARAFRWQGLLEDGIYESCAELAKTEKINPSYVARVLRLTLLAPDIVRAIIDGQHEFERFTVDRLRKPFPSDWRQQARMLNSQPRPVKSAAAAHRH